MEKLINAMLFNIQLFADASLNTNVTTDEGLTDAMKTYYDKLLIATAQPNLIHDQFADMRNIPPHGGKTIEFRKYTPYKKALVPLQEGVTPKGHKLELKTITAEIKQYGDFTPVSDILSYSAIDDEISVATEQCGNQAGLTLDTVTREVLVGGTNVYYAPKVTSVGADTPTAARHLLTPECVFTPDCAFQGRTILASQNTPKIDGSYVAIINPYCSYDIMRNKEWIDVSKYAEPDNYYKGEIGKIGGIRFVESTEAKVWRGDDLASDARDLVADSASGSTITFSGGTVAAHSLKGRYIIVKENKYLVTDNTTSTITIDGTIDSASSDPIYPGEGGAKGCAVFAVMIMGKNAYATTKLENGGLKQIFHDFGSGGTSDALDQVATVGWKATKTAERLAEEYMVRIECGSSHSDVALAN